MKPGVNRRKPEMRAPRQAAGRQRRRRRRRCRRSWSRCRGPGAARLRWRSFGAGCDTARRGAAAQRGRHHVSKTLRLRRCNAGVSACGGVAVQGAVHTWRQRRRRRGQGTSPRRARGGGAASAQQPRHAAAQHSAEERRRALPCVSLAASRVAGASLGGASSLRLLLLGACWEPAAAAPAACLRAAARRVSRRGQPSHSRAKCLQSPLRHCDTPRYAARRSPCRPRRAAAAGRSLPGRPPRPRQLSRLPGAANQRGSPLPPPRAAFAARAVLDGFSGRLPRRVWHQ